MRRLGIIISAIIVILVACSMKAWALTNDFSDQDAFLLPDATDTVTVEDPFLSSDKFNPFIPSQILLDPSLLDTSLLNQPLLVPNDPPDPPIDLGLSLDPFLKQNDKWDGSDKGGEIQPKERVYDASSSDAVVPFPHKKELDTDTAFVPYELSELKVPDDGTGYDPRYSIIEYSESGKELSPELFLQRMKNILSGLEDLEEALRRIGDNKGAEEINEIVKFLLGVVGVLGGEQTEGTIKSWLEITSRKFKDIVNNSPETKEAIRDFLREKGGYILNNLATLGVRGAIFYGSEVFPQLSPQEQAGQVNEIINILENENVAPAEKQLAGAIAIQIITLINDKSLQFRLSEAMLENLDVENGVITLRFNDEMNEMGGVGVWEFFYEAKKFIGQMSRAGGVVLGIVSTDAGVFLFSSLASLPFIGALQGDFTLAEFLKMAVKPLEKSQLPLKAAAKDAKPLGGHFMPYLQYAFLAYAFLALKKKASREKLSLICGTAIKKAAQEKESLKILIRAKLPEIHKPLINHPVQVANVKFGINKPQISEPALKRPAADRLLRELKRPARRPSPLRKEPEFTNAQLRQLDIDVDKSLSEIKYWANYLATLNQGK